MLLRPSQSSKLEEPWCDSIVRESIIGKKENSKKRDACKYWNLATISDQSPKRPFARVLIWPLKAKQKRKWRDEKSERWEGKKGDERGKREDV